jgi:hypothetical protein
VLEEHTVRSTLHSFLTSLLAAALLGLWGAPAACQDDFAEARRQMVREIAAMVRDNAAETGRARLDARVMATMGRVPRHRFVSPEHLRQAYANRPLPIGHGQTISQPYIVALMTDLLGLAPGDKAREIGTGSGHRAAVLALAPCAGSEPRSLSDLRLIDSPSGKSGPFWLTPKLAGGADNIPGSFLPDFSLHSPTMRLEIVQNCPRSPTRLAFDRSSPTGS